MSKILLINPAMEFEPRDEKVYSFPFGLAYIASYLKQAGHQVDVWDIHAERVSYQEARASLPTRISKGYDHIGITGIVNQYLYVKGLAEAIKEHSDAVITAGGPLATYSYEILLRESPIDLCVIGSGEYTYAEVVAGGAWDQIGGLALRDDARQIVVTGAARFPEHLDNLPKPAYDLFDMEFYLAHTRLMTVVHPWHRDRKVASLATSRGCPYRCRFCSKSIQRTATHSVDYVVEQIRYLQSRHGIDALLFLDELAVLSKKRTLALCGELRPLNIIWNAQARVNIIDREVLLAMKKSGCTCIGFGIESGSQRVLNNMNKNITVTQIRNALELCKEIGLPVKVQLIFGYPGEDDHSIQETLALFRDLRYPGCRMTMITPLPGSPLYDEAKTDGFIGDEQDCTISEVAFMEFLSLNAGMCQRHFFYNRTAFSDSEFLAKMDAMHRKFLTNWAQTFAFHPLHMIRHRAVYKCYLRHWINYYRGVFKRQRFLMSGRE